MLNETKIFVFPTSQIYDRVKRKIINIKVFWKCVIEAGPN